MAEERRAGKRRVEKKEGMFSMRTMRRGGRGLESVRSGENYKRVGHKIYLCYVTYIYIRMYYKRDIHTPTHTAGSLV